MYGSTFTKSYGEEVDLTGAWRATLYGKDEAQIKNGLANLADRGGKYPPNAEEFRNLCTKKRKDQFVHPSHREFVSEKRIQKGTKEERKAFAQKHINEIYEILGVKPKR